MKKILFALTLLIASFAASAQQYKCYPVQNVYYDAYARPVVVSEIKCNYYYDPQPVYVAPPAPVYVQPQPIYVQPQSSDSVAPFVFGAITGIILNQHFRNDNYHNHYRK